MAIEAFTNALGDQLFRVKILERELKTPEEALTIAFPLEALHLSANICNDQSTTILIDDSGRKIDARLRVVKAVDRIPSAQLPAALTPSGHGGQSHQSRGVSNNNGGFKGNSNYNSKRRVRGKGNGNANSNMQGGRGGRQPNSYMLQQ